MAALPKTLPHCVKVEMVVPKTLEERPTTLRKHQNGAPLPFQNGELFEVEFVSRRCLCSGEDVRPLYEVRFSHELSEAFAPGSALGVVCPNVHEDVEVMLKRLKLNGNECLTIGPAEEEGKLKTRFDRSFSYVPAQCTVRHLFEYVVDLRTVLKKSFLKILGDCCPESSVDRRLLHELSSTNQEGYRKDVLEGRMMIFHLLERFPTCQPSLSVLVEFLNRLSPRFYSVANYAHNEIHFIYRPMQFQSQGRMLIGQCSEMFAQLQNSNSSNDLNTTMENLSLNESTCTKKVNKILFYRRKNVRSFSFPMEPPTRFMFVCHGTGVVPFLAYLQWLKVNSNQRPSEFWLFYGCRYADRDSLVNLDSVSESGCKLEVRQSRQDGDVQMGYVQDGLMAQAETVRNCLIKDSGQLLICGDFQTMVKDTLAVLGNILDVNIVDSLMKENRIKLDIWT